MTPNKTLTIAALNLALAGALAAPAAVHADNDRRGDYHEHDSQKDFGAMRDRLLDAQSMQLFGIKGALNSASTRSVDAATAEADPRVLVTVANSLRARVVSADPALGANIDMMTLWPIDHPTHLIVCNEQGPGHPGLQRVRLSDGKVDTILTGTSSCDPAHATPWGTVVFGEEAGSSGTLFEIMDPLHTTGVVYDRNAGTFRGADAANVTERPAVGHLSFEGVAVYPNGIVYYGDENRPAKGVAGGAYFKFVPSVPWTGGAPISNLDQSPLASGSVLGLRLGTRSGNTDFGQGSNTGRGAWVPVDNAYDGDLRTAAADLQLTGFYRPEDANADLKQLAKGNVRFCANNTGNEEDNRNWGETICVTDGSLDEAAANTAIPEVQRLVEGTKDFAMMDNIAYEPGRGNWIMHEDRDAVGMTGEGYPFNDSIWMCLEDGSDADTLSDGCLRIATLNDLNAESTGGLFDEQGGHYYFSVQHNVTGHGVILDVTGWR